MRPGHELASGDGTLNEGKRKVRSPAALSCSRLVARIRTRGQPISSVAATIAASTITCSQLSRISSNALFFRYVTSVSSNGRFGTSCTPSVEAIVAATNEGSLIGASPMKQVASSPASLSAIATCNAVCVLPMPPAPVSVTIRCSRTILAISSSSVSRPTKLVSASGRVAILVSGHGPTATEVPRRTTSTRVAAASNMRRCSPLSASAPAKSTSVSGFGVRR